MKNLNYDLLQIFIDELLYAYGSDWNQHWMLSINHFTEINENVWSKPNSFLCFVASRASFHPNTKYRLHGIWFHTYGINENMSRSDEKCHLIYMYRPNPLKRTFLWQIPVNTICFPEGSRCMRTG